MLIPIKTIFKMKTHIKVVFSVLVIIFVFESCVVNPVTGKKDLMLLSEDQEMAMGASSDPEIVNFYGMYQDENLQNFIDVKGAEMAAISHRPQLDYDFKILDSPVVNAFAVPGGYVYFTRGIMAHFNNEAEFAGVLGHEIGHITARHSARQYSSQMVAQLGMAVGMAASPQFRQYGDIAMQSLGLLFLKFSRDHETESDVLGVEYSSKIGYDAREMADFFETLHRLSAGSEAANLPDFMSTHPNPIDRNRNVKALATQWQQAENLTNPEVNRNGYLRMIDGLVYGDDPQQGYVENSVFYHPVLKFRYPIPQGWDHSNTSTQVQMAPQGGKALMILRLAEGTSLEEAAKKFVEQNQIQVIDSGKGEINNFPIVEVYGDQTQEENVVRLGSWFILYNDLIYQFIGMSLQADFNGFNTTFHHSVTNFDALRDPAKINVKADRIRIKTVQKTISLASVLQSYGVKQDMMERTAILNSMQLNDVLEKGTLIKVVSK